MTRHTLAAKSKQLIHKHDAGNRQEHTKSGWLTHTGRQQHTKENHAHKYTQEAQHKQRLQHEMSRQEHTQAARSRQQHKQEVEPNSMQPCNMSRYRQQHTGSGIVIVQEAHKHRQQPQQCLGGNRQGNNIHLMIRPPKPTSTSRQTVTCTCWNRASTQADRQQPEQAGPYTSNLGKHQHTKTSRHTCTPKLPCTSSHQQADTSTLHVSAAPSRYRQQQPRRTTQAAQAMKYEAGHMQTATHNRQT